MRHEEGEGGRREGETIQEGGYDEARRGGGGGGGKGGIAKEVRQEEDKGVVEGVAGTK